MGKLQKISSALIGFLLIANPVLANPIESFIVSMRASGFQLILLWLLTLSVVYGVLAHLSIPKSATVRGVISIVVAAMVLMAAAGTQAASFVSSLSTSAIVIAFGLLITLSFLEIVGAKVSGEHIFAIHPKFFAGALILLAILVFVGAGGMGLLNIPSIRITDPLISILFFLAVMLVTIWILTKE